MISWRFSILIAVVFCSKVAFSCYSSSDCVGYGETCCSDDTCRSDCSNDGLSIVIVIIIIVIGLVLKTVFWVSVCYCCRRRRRYGGITFTRLNNAPTTVVVNSSSNTQVHSSTFQENNPVQQGYSPPQQIYSSPEQQGYSPPQQIYSSPEQQGYSLPQQGYKPSQQGHEMVNPVSNPPPPYTENPESWFYSLYLTVSYSVQSWILVLPISYSR